MSATWRGSRWLIGCTLLGLLLAGCGGSPPAPPPAARSGGPPPDDPPLDDEPAASAQPATEVAAVTPSQTPALPGSGDLPSGSYLPPGGETREDLFEPLAGAAGGQRFAIDGGAGTNVDTFAVAIVDGKADSSRFLAPAPKVDTAKIMLPEGMSLLDGYTVVDEAGVSPEGLPLRVKCEWDGSIMALVPAGTFQQGKSSGPKECQPEHGVYLDAFYIDVHEVTVRQYEAYRTALRDGKKRAPPAALGSDPDEPARGVTYNDAMLYARYYSKDLPTEAQWEKAARGAEGFDHPWGNGLHVWHRARTPQQVDRVQSFPQDQSPFGVFDLAGNVREWCADWYSEGTYAQRLSGTEVVPRNPAGPRASGGQFQRVVKGGDPQWRVWARTGVVQTERPADVGFRCVLNVRAAAAAAPPKDE